LGWESYPECLALRSTDDSQAIAIAASPNSLLQPGAEPSQAGTFQLHFEFAGDELFFVGYSLTQAKGAIRVFSRPVHCLPRRKEVSTVKLTCVGPLDQMHRNWVSSEPEPAPPRRRHPEWPSGHEGSGGSRMSVRRFTRLTNAFSKRYENHCHMVAIYCAYYNFCRVHQTLRVTPAMDAGLSDHVLTLQALVSLLEYNEHKQVA
jgi:hypothetical protein